MSEGTCEHGPYYANDATDYMLEPGDDGVTYILKPGDKVMYKQQQTLKPSRATKIKTVGRNQPCPCGSGIKYKKCHGKV